MNNFNMHTPTSRVLAVIEGGLHAKASIQKTPAVQQPKLLDQVRGAIGMRHYSPKTEDSYVIGSNGSSFSTTNGTRPRWAKKRLRNSFQASPGNCT